MSSTVTWTATSTHNSGTVKNCQHLLETIHMVDELWGYETGRRLESLNNKKNLCEYFMTLSSFYS